MKVIMVLELVLPHWHQNGGEGVTKAVSVEPSGHAKCVPSFEAETGQ